MKSEYSIYRYNDDIGQKILGLFAYVKQMTDTDYFEAKPRRAIGFEEIKKVLLPEGASEKLINALQEKGIDYTTYPEGQSRSDIIQKMDEVKFSRKNDNVYHFINKLAKIEVSWNEESDTYHLYCENARGYLEYEGTLTEDELESRFGEELGLDLEQKAWEKDGGVATLDRSWIEYYADEIKPEEKYDDDYLAEAKEEYGTTDNVLLAGYINTDGSMLDFSGGYESRFIDHSEIDVIFDDESGADATQRLTSEKGITPKSKVSFVNLQARLPSQRKKSSPLKRSWAILATSSKTTTKLFVTESMWTPSLSQTVI